MTEPSRKAQTSLCFPREMASRHQYSSLLLLAEANQAQQQATVLGSEQPTGTKTKTHFDPKTTTTTTTTTLTEAVAAGGNGNNSELLGRKKSSRGGKTTRKQPQRGPGVAQLERLRLQERWKRITQANRLETVDLNLEPDLQITLHDPINRLPPLQYACGIVNAGPGVCVPTVISTNSGGGGGDVTMTGSHQPPFQAMVMKRTDNSRNGVTAFSGSNRSCFGPDQVLVSPYTVGAPEGMVQVGTTAASVLLETSKELSSMPKMVQQCEYQHPCCDHVCTKRNKFKGERKVAACDGRPDQFADMSSINGSGSMGVSLGNGIHFAAEETGGFSLMAARNAAFYANRNMNEANDPCNFVPSDHHGVELVAIHRKCNPLTLDAMVLKEYEFIPRKCGNGTRFKEMEFPAPDKAPVAAAVDAEASCVTTSDYSGCGASNASNFVDLSLKLSY